MGSTEAESARSGQQGAEAGFSRRDFLASSAAAAAFTVVPSHVMAGGGLSPSDKLDLALIGTCGRARAHYGWMSDENVVALCDIDEKNLARAAKKFKGTDHYTDWRRCLDDHQNYDGVVICTPDHQHAFISTWAMNRDLHVYSEKPLGISVEEARTVRQKYLEKKDKLAVQLGTQRHAYSNFNRVRELIRRGAIGELKRVHAWGRRQIPKPGYPPKEGSPPDYLHYDKWVGPSQYHPFNPSYFAGYKLDEGHSGEPGGSNCLNWNMYWDFGSGQIGDMGAHTMDLAWNALRPCGHVTSAKAEGEEFNPDVTPVKMHSSFRLPANDWRSDVEVHWWQGQMMPSDAWGHINLNRIGHGTMFQGDKGFLIASFGNRTIIPVGRDADMSYYDAPSEDEVTEAIGGWPAFAKQWTNACKTDLETSCDFGYAGTLAEMMELGLVAYRVGDKKLKYDGDKGRVTNSKKGNDLLSRNYRNGWKLDG